MKGWNLKMGLPNHLCLVKSWLRFACQLQLAKLCFQTESQLLINSLCKWIWHSLEILAVSSNQDIRIYKIYCIFVIGIHVELRLFGYSDFSWNIQICNLTPSFLLHLHSSSFSLTRRPRLCHSYSGLSSILWYSQVVHQSQLCLCALNQRRQRSCLRWYPTIDVI